MTDRDALLKAVLSNPDDDTFRGVLADWLTENGEEARGEFIRVQCELAREPHCVNCGGRGQMSYTSFTATCRWCRPAWLKLRRREWSLLDTLLSSFRSELPLSRPNWNWRISVNPLDRPDEEYTAFANRGFVSHLTLPASDWLDNCRRLAWRPEWDQTCSRCGGDGKAHGADRPFEWNDRADYGKCVVCWDEWLRKATGRVPRPFYPSCQPLEKVTLITDPLRLYTYHGGCVYSRNSQTFQIQHPKYHMNRSLGVVSAEWPGIKFKIA